MKPVFDAFVHQLEHLGAAHHLADHARHAPASDETIAAIEAIAGPLPADLAGWWRVADRALPFDGAMTSIAPVQAAKEMQRNQKMIEEGAFDDPLQNIRSWDDGRWRDGRMKEVYWHPGWVPFAEDGCGNLICVDLDPGSHGTIGQIIQMEFQEGQGPYLSPWPDFSALILGHLYLLEHRRVDIDEDMAIEYPDLSSSQMVQLLAALGR
ncbi:MAG: SMI1/KNR4 family protein [Myxococcota bacterium]